MFKTATFRPQLLDALLVCVNGVAPSGLSDGGRSPGNPCSVAREHVHNIVTSACTRLIALVAHDGTDTVIVVQVFGIVRTAALYMPSDVLLHGACGLSLGCHRLWSAAATNLSFASNLCPQTSW